ncbi:MAG: hypothetical protein ACI96N_002736 [Arenicella sp.]|jgi:hypothetical protein
MVFERFGQSITLVLEKLVELWLLFLIYNYIIEVKEWCFQSDLFPIYNVADQVVVSSK